MTGQFFSKTGKAASRVSVESMEVPFKADGTAMVMVRAITMDDGCLKGAVGDRFELNNLGPHLDPYFTKVCSGVQKELVTCSGARLRSG
ncbi:MAG: hypothetical protein Kow00107_03920 [Planctomycetota bacterium]